MNALVLSLCRHHRRRWRCLPQQPSMQACTCSLYRLHQRSVCRFVG